MTRPAPCARWVRADAAMPSFVRTQEVEHAIGRDGRVALRVTSPEVELRAVDGEVARVRIEFDIRSASDADADAAFESLQFAVHRGNGVLELTEPKRGSHGLASIAGILGISSTRVETQVVVEIPRRAALAYTGVSADVTAVGLRGAQEYRTVSGDLVLTDGGGTIAVNGVSSDISLRADEPISLRANTVSGDLSVFAPRLEESRIVTVSGDIELEGDLGRDLAHRVESVSGDLSLGVVGGLTLEVRGLSTDVAINLAHRSEGSRDRRRYVIGDGASSLLFSSMSGDVLVHTARRVAAPPPPPRPPAPPRPQPLSDGDRLEVLRALERGEIDVDEASRRLARGGSGG